MISNFPHRVTIWIIAPFLLLFIPVASAQVDLPDKPIIQQVSIDTTQEHRTAVVKWSASETAPLRSYKVYTLDISTNPVTGTYLDSLEGDCTCLEYQHVTDTVFIYTVTAVDMDGNESLLGGDYHRPVQVSTAYDSCSSAMVLNWTNYIGWKNSLSGYRVYGKQENGPYQLIGLLDSAKLSFSHLGVTENSQYSYVVEAFNNRGIASTSNYSSYFTYMAPPPDFISLDYVSVIDEASLELGFSIDLNGEIDDFLITRANSSSGDFSPVNVLYDLQSNSQTYIDNVVTTGNSYFYKVEAINGCGKAISSSNEANNILISGSASGSEVELEWTPYEGFEDGIESYELFRKSETGEYIYLFSAPDGITRFSEDLRQMGTGTLNGAVTYKVEALESGTNPLGVAGVSSSNEVTVNLESQIHLPSAFSPNDDGLNEMFEPLLDFYPLNYRMIIYDRSGMRLFTSTDPTIGWNGLNHKFEPVAEGVYVYHIEYQSHNGVRKVKTGTVTVVY